MTNLIKEFNFMKKKIILLTWYINNDRNENLNLKMQMAEVTTFISIIDGLYVIDRLLWIKLKNEKQFHEQFYF